MKSILLLSLATALSQTGAALSLHERSEPATLGYAIERKSSNVNSRRKRDTSSVTINSANDLDLYSFNFTLGTPGQPISVGLDTGSSDLWMNAQNSTYCALHRSKCDSSDKFDPSKSDSYKVLNHGFKIQYGDNTGAEGDYATDTLKFGNVTLDEFQFAVGYVTSTELGIMGIGYESLEAVDQSRTAGPEYKNLPQALVKAGYINSPAYSLWLDDLESRKGQILFGGVNTAKYSGELHTLPIIKEHGDYLEFLVNMTGLSFSNGTKETSYSKGFPTPVLLDSGTTLSYLPDDAVEDILNDVGTYDVMLQTYTVDCDMRSTGYNLTFEFPGFSMTVDIAEMILEAQDNICIFGIDFQGTETAVLGDTFLRSAYVVYDLGNNEISMAPANFDPGEDNILEIGTGSSAVPTATGAPTGTGTTTAATATSTSGASETSEGAAMPMMTASPKLMAGLAGAGLLLAL